MKATMKKATWYTAAALLVMLFGMSVSSCGDDPNSLDPAWQALQDGDYASAHARFAELALTDTTGGAYVGLGWVTLLMSTDSLQASDRYFTLVAEDSIDDGYAGWSVTKWALKDYASVIPIGDVVINHDPFYVFTYESSIDINDIILHQAYSYYHMNQYSGCIVKIQALDPSFTATPNQSGIATLLLSKLEALAKVY